MNFQEIWQTISGFWQGKWQEFVRDVRRLDAASRPMTAGSIMLGLLYGCIPLASLIVMFRLTDAVTGARGVRVQTSDLTEAMLSLGVVWVLWLMTSLTLRKLHGVTGSIARRVACLAWMSTLVGCIMIIAPFRVAICLLAVAGLTVYRVYQRMRYLAALLITLTSVSLFVTLQDFLLARAVTVGSFLLFAGATLLVASRGVVHMLDRGDA